MKLTALIVDDVPRLEAALEAGAATAGGSLLINPRLFDLERVEIVKGPQIALYGRSAFAGAISTLAEPCSPITLWWIVPYCSGRALPPGVRRQDSGIRSQEPGVRSRVS